MACLPVLPYSWNDASEHSTLNSGNAQFTQTCLHPCAVESKMLDSLCWCIAQALVTSSQLAADLRQSLLNPERSKKAGTAASLNSCALPRSLQEALVKKYNAPQQCAVAACLTGPNRFTLVQVWHIITLLSSCPQETSSSSLVSKLFNV